MDLADDRASLLEKAEAALTAGNQADYDSAMEKVRNYNKQMEDLNDLIQEETRQAVKTPGPRGSEAQDIAEERGQALLRGDRVDFAAVEVLRAVRNSVTLATGTLVQPTGAGTDIRDTIGGNISSIIDQVRVVDLTGMGSFLEPYVISELEASAGTPATLAGTARTTSADPTFGVAEIRPYEVNVTTFVDRNISRLSPANYYEKIYGMAMRALRRKVAGFIVNGDGQTSPIMYGIKNATNKAGSSIYTTVDVSGVDIDLLDTLYFAYGSSSEMGPTARLLLTKADLKALGALRGTNEKRRLLEIIPDAGNPNTGTIRDGGMVLPYTISADLTSLAGATQDTSAIQTMLYGDPMNYELGLFGAYSIRVDESVKAVERMVAILGDAFVGGNLVVDKGFVVATVPAKSA